MGAILSRNAVLLATTVTYLGDWTDRGTGRVMHSSRRPAYICHHDHTPARGGAVVARSRDLAHAYGYRAPEQCCRCRARWAPLCQPCMHRLSALPAHALSGVSAVRGADRWSMPR